MSFSPTIGLEIHIELGTNSKMFCSCKNDSEEKRPNFNICPICLAHPGTLPVINEKAVDLVIKTALALNCKIEKHSFFERKNYFYPDLPKGYQISQYQIPLSRNGFLEISPRGENKVVRINRIHLEEDTGRLIHPEKENYSLVDFNRAGVPLMELVTEPDISSGEEARKFAKEFQLILRYLGVSGANMEKGEMRCEVNISLSKDFSLGTKVEVKNLNSLRAVEKSINYETARQSELLRKGKKVVQETRGWDNKKEITFSQREKEESHDYHYFPEPDLPPLNISEKFIEKIKNEIGELPQQKRERFKKEYFLSDEDVEIYVFQKNLGDYFEKVVSELKNWIKEKKPTEKIDDKEFEKVIKIASNYISSDLQGFLEGESVGDENFKITPENFAEFISMIYFEEISSKIAKILLKAMFETGGDPSQIIEDKGLNLITDNKQIEKVVRDVIKKNQKAVDDYKGGKETSLQFLVGQVMAITKGTANPKEVINVFKKTLS